MRIYVSLTKSCHFFHFFVFAINLSLTKIEDFFFYYFMFYFLFCDPFSFFASFYFSGIIFAFLNVFMVFIKFLFFFFFSFSFHFELRQNDCCHGKSIEN